MWVQNSICTGPMVEVTCGSSWELSHIQQCSGLGKGKDVGKEYIITSIWFFPLNRHNLIVIASNPTWSWSSLGHLGSFTTSLLQRAAGRLKWETYTTYASLSSFEEGENKKWIDYTRIMSCGCKAGDKFKHQRNEYCKGRRKGASQLAPRKGWQTFF